MAQGQAERFEVLYRAHYQRVVGYCVRRCADPATAADAVAETFLILWRRFDDAPDDAAVGPWLYGIARRVLSNQRRSADRRDALATRLAEDVTALVVTRAPEAGEITAIRRAFSQLRPADQELLGLLAWEGLDRDAIAQSLGVSRATVRVRLHRARQRFARALTREGLEFLQPGSVPTNQEVS